jgi:peptidoglycan lytic transglycosylase B
MNAIRAVKILSAMGIAMNFCASASAQQTSSITSTFAPPAATPGSATPPAGPQWSGQSGSSGHPLMTAEAIRLAAGNFSVCLERLWPEAARRGVSRDTFVKHTAELTPDLRIMDFLDAQPEFTTALWGYLDSLVSAERIAMGAEMLRRHRTTFEQVEQVYGVDRHIIAAIWGVESRYGSMIGDRPVLRSTATLACVGRRQAFFRDEFLATLEILHRGDVRVEQLKGSWAGAFGPTQFMPTTFKRFAVDFDGDGRRDVVESIPDVLASTANNLKKDGWIPGQPWGYEVSLPQGFDYLLADRTRQLALREWDQLGVRRPDGAAFQRNDERAFLLLPAGAQGPAFLMLSNFLVLMKYNPAEAYALAIGHLADRLRGDGPIVQPWPRHEAVLTRDERRQLQELLLSRGFDLGEADGRLGLRSRAAIRDFQVSTGLVPDGFATADILARLRNR